jgi:DNA-directed RNA polymerase subunit omega
MPLLPLEQLLVHVDSKYRLVIIAAKRAKQLMRGGEPLIAPKSTKPTYIALEEMGAGKLTYEAELAHGALPQEVLPPEGIPTWIRSLSAEETLGEGVTVEEEGEEKEELDIEEAAPELLAEASEEPGMTGLDALESPEAAEDEA